MFKSTRSNKNQNGQPPRTRQSSRYNLMISSVKYDQTCVQEAQRSNKMKGGSMKLIDTPLDP